MTKAAICVACMDIIAPRRAWQTDRSWRWCECDHAGVRWRDGSQGTLEVTSLHGTEGVRVLGLNNLFLEEAVRTRDTDAAGWRAWHEATCEQVEPYYLFHVDKRNCWALVVRPGESGDVHFVAYPTARTESP